MMAYILQRGRVQRWRGLTVPDSTQRPFVFSDPVPEDQKWILLAVSAWDAFPSPETLALFAVPPGVFSFGPSIVAQFNTPPYSPAVMLSTGNIGGGVPLDQTTELITGTTSSSVQLLAPGYRKYRLAPKWRLLAVQSQNGGGGSGFMEMSAYFIPVGVAEDICNPNSNAGFAPPPPRRTPKIYGTVPP